MSRENPARTSSARAENLMLTVYRRLITSCSNGGNVTKILCFYVFFMDVRKKPAIKMRERERRREAGGV
jgi:hypothetical protein